MLRIPIIDANASITEVTLDGRPFFIRMAWNSEDQYWAWGLESSNRQSLVEGRKLVPDSALLKWCRRVGFPPGELMAIAPDRRDTIDREALPSGEVKLIYIAESEL